MCALRITSGRIREIGYTIKIFSWYSDGFHLPIAPNGGYNKISTVAGMAMVLTNKALCARGGIPIDKGNLR